MRALVLGVNGQDGSYLAEELLKSGYDVIGVGKQLQSRYVSVGENFLYVQQDLRDCVSVKELLYATKPDAIYNMAAVHGSAGFSYEDHSIETLQVNAVLVEVLLEYLHKGCRQTTLTCAGSAKQFGELAPGTVVNETSFRKSNCLYSISKNAANDLLRYYRDRYGLHVGMIYYWNHESTRRSELYFIPTLVKALKGAIMGKEEKTIVRTLDFLCDWGSAEEYMHLTRLLAERAPEQDVIMATGQTRSGGDLAESLFSLFEKKSMDHLNCLEREKHAVLKHAERGWKVDNTLLHRLIGKTPRIRIEDVCLNMLADRKELEGLRGWNT